MQQRNHDALTAMGRALLASGQLGSLLPMSQVIRQASATTPQNRLPRAGQPAGVEGAADRSLRRRRALHWEEVSAYQTLVVGTDGSDTSLRAVEHAAAFAAENNAKLIIAMAHLPEVDRGGWGRSARPDRVIDGRAEVVLGGEGDYKVHGKAPVYGILREARDRARAAGAKNIETRPILVGRLGGPAHALSRLAKEVKADLLVVGNVGLGTPSDKWLGSVPGNVLRRAKADVLIVHTTD